MRIIYFNSLFCLHIMLMNFTWFTQQSRIISFNNTPLSFCNMNCFISLCCRNRISEEYLRKFKTQMAMTCNGMFVMFYGMGRMTSKRTKFGSIRLLLWVDNASRIMLFVLVFFTLQTTELCANCLTSPISDSSYIGNSVPFLRVSEYTIVKQIQFSPLPPNH